MENKNKKNQFYIPKGASEKVFWFKGFSKDEFLIIMPFIIVLLVMCVAFNMMFQKLFYTMLLFSIGIIGLVIFISKDDTNISVIDMITYMILFQYSKKEYPFIMLNEYEFEEEE